MPMKIQYTIYKCLKFLMIEVYEYFSNLSPQIIIDIFKFKKCVQPGECSLYCMIELVRFRKLFPLK